MKYLTPAEKLLQGLGIRSPEEIDLEAIAYLQGASVKFRSLDNCEARIVGVGDKAVISVKRGVSERRQRFSLAHELGHWKWHKGQVLECRTTGSFSIDPQQQKEKIADQFAADLLMPDYLFRPVIKSYRQLKLQTINEVANLFRVSFLAAAIRIFLAAAIRIIEMNEFPSMIVYHGKEGRRWFNRAKDIPDKWFPKQELSEESTAFDLLFGDQANDKFSSKVSADLWFDHPQSSYFSVNAQSCRIIQREVLTLLNFTDEKMLSDE